jgi:hypothetical protein
MLCTHAQVKARLGIVATDTTDDATFDEIIAGVSAAMAKAAGRTLNGVPCLEYGSYVQYFSPPYGAKYIWSAAWPIVAVSEVNEALFEAFATGHVLTVNQDYQVRSPLGRLYRIGMWLPGESTVRLTYTAGYTFAAAWISGAAYAVGDVVQDVGIVYACKSIVSGSTHPATDTTHWTLQAGQIPLPFDVINAAIKQAQFEYQRKSQVGLASSSAGGSAWAGDPDGLLDVVKKLMASYGRRVGA